MAKLKIILLLALLLPSPTFASPSCDIAASIIKSVSLIRGLIQKHTVPCAIQMQGEVKKFLLDAIENKIPKEKIENEEKLFKAIGFLPQNFNYKEGLIELYTSQLGGYYDPDANRYVMAGWLPDAMQPTIAAHELTHALQDQYFDLSTFTDEEKLTTDELLARSALLEGDATAVMTDYQKKLMGQPLLAKDKNIDNLLLSNIIGASFMAKNTGAPESLQMMLFFPYTSGFRFAHSLLIKGGYKEIDNAFKSPPTTTKEILHPELFGEVLISDPIKGDSDGYRDRFGEFFISALLGMYSRNKGEAAEAANGWMNDTAVREKNGKVSWKTEWNTTKDAEQFLTMYKETLSKLYPKGGYDLKIIGKAVTFSIKS